MDFIKKLLVQQTKIQINWLTIKRERRK